MSNSYVIITQMTKFDDEVKSLLPAETRRVQELAARGLIKACLVRADFGGAYLVMEAESDAQLHTALESLPLHPFMKLEIVPCRPVELGQR